jgi:hypothetical protein
VRFTLMATHIPEFATICVSPAQDRSRRTVFTAQITRRRTTTALLSVSATLTGTAMDVNTTMSSHMPLLVSVIQNVWADVPDQLTWTVYAASKQLTLTNSVLVNVILTTEESHVTFQLTTDVMLDAMAVVTVCPTMTVSHV